MTPVVKNFSFKSSIVNPKSEIHQDMTPDEVTRHLDERDRQRHLAQINFVVNAAIIIVAAALLYVTYQFFTK